MAETLTLRGVLQGHENWVTTVATSSQNPNMLLSGGRDKKVIVWEITRDVESFGFPKKSLVGHSHFVEDVVISSDGNFALSSSWDTSLRLWDLNSGKTVKKFIGHGKDVLSVAFSADNRQIVSGSRDKTIKLWNTLGECKWTIEDSGHSEWVSCVRFSPNLKNPLVVSGGWDNSVKVWNLTNLKLKYNLIGHTGPVNTVTVSPDGSLCASGGKDATVRLWDLKEGTELYSLEAGSTVNALTFSPNRYWLCAGTDKAVVIWDLESKGVVAELNEALVAQDGTVDFLPAGIENAASPKALSLAWSADGTTLYAGYGDNMIRVWEVTRYQ